MLTGSWSSPFAFRHDAPARARAHTQGHAVHTLCVKPAHFIRGASQWSAGRTCGPPNVSHNAAHGAHIYAQTHTQRRAVPPRYAHSHARAFANGPTNSLYTYPCAHAALRAASTALMRVYRGSGWDPRTFWKGGDVMSWNALEQCNAPGGCTPDTFRSTPLLARSLCWARNTRTSASGTPRPGTHRSKVVRASNSHVNGATTERRRRREEEGERE